MGNNGDLKTQKEKVEEIKSQTQLDNSTKEVKESPQEQPKDFKIAEIWLRDGQIMLDACENFWADRCRALGVLEFCKEIVKTAKSPEKSKIIPVKGSYMNRIRSFLGRKK